ncbi:MAG TPA: class I SAM-dependent methyltransferase [Caulobacteraceae bacterium]|nr:class I SAM-dependent methyltransferase [Caulobacteraceae bacterium]
MSELSDRIIDLYERHSRAWSDARGTKLIETAWLERFCAVLPTRAVILDVGCGPGEPIGRYLANRGFSVVGVDSSPAMIELFRGHLPDQEAVISDMRSLALDRRFDGLIAWDSFFHLSHDDQRAMFSIFAAHAEEGAPLLFTTGPQHGEAIGELEGEPLYHPSLARTEYRSLLEAHGFEEVAHVANDPACGRHTVWLARRL